MEVVHPRGLGDGLHRRPPLRVAAFGVGFRAGGQVCGAVFGCVVGNGGDGAGRGFDGGDPVPVQRCEAVGDPDPVLQCLATEHGWRVGDRGPGPGGGVVAGVGNLAEPESGFGAVPGVGHGVPERPRVGRLVGAGVQAGGGGDFGQALAGEEGRGEGGAGPCLRAIVLGGDVVALAAFDAVATVQVIEGEPKRCCPGELFTGAHPVVDAGEPRGAGVVQSVAGPCGRGVPVGFLVVVEGLGVSVQVNDG